MRARQIISLEWEIRRRASFFNTAWTIGSVGAVPLDVSTAGVGSTLAAVGASNVRRLTGTTWIQENVTFNLHQLGGVFVASPGAAYAVGYDAINVRSVIHRRNAAGWTQVYPSIFGGGFNNRLFAAHGNATGTEVMAVGDNGRALRTTDGGANWFNVATGAGRLNDVWFDGTTFFAVGNGGWIGVSSGGATFTVMNSGTFQAINGIWGSGPNDVWAVGNGGTVLHYDGNAQNQWTAVTSPVLPAAENFQDVTGVGTQQVIVVGTNLYQYR